MATVRQRGGTADEEGQRERPGTHGASAPAYDGDAVAHRGGTDDGLAARDVLLVECADLATGLDQDTPPPT